MPTYTPLPTPPVIVIVATATPTPTSTPTPTPLGYEIITSVSGVNIQQNGKVTAIFNRNLDVIGEIDVYKFDALKGQDLIVSMISAVIDTHLELIDPEGNVEMKVDDSGGSTTATIIRELSSSGLYTLYARSATQGTGELGLYTINFQLSP